MSISDIVNEIIQINKLQSGIDQVAVRDVWAEVMGNGVNSYTQGVSLRNGVLYVDLTSSVLREELSYGKQKMIVMINEALRRDVIKNIVLR